MVTRPAAPAWRRAKSVLESTRAAPPSEVAQISRRRRGSATIGEARTSSTVTSAAVAGVGVGQAVAGVLDLDGGEVVLGGPEELHAAAGVEGEVGRVGGAHEVEPEPVGIVLAVAADGGEEALGGGVGPHHQGHVAEPGQDLGPGGGDGRGARRRRRRRSWPPGPRSIRGPGRRWRRPRSRDSRCGWCRRRRRTGRRAMRGRRRPGRHGGGQPVLDEVASPLAPGVHAHPEDGDPLVVSHGHLPMPSPTRAPLPDEVLVVVVLVEDVDDELDLGRRRRGRRHRPRGRPAP